MTPPNAVQSDSNSPHQGQPVRTAGASIPDASAAVVLFHGRGGTATDILLLSDDLDRPAVTYRAPQASDRTWYPHSFLAPLQKNEPHLSSALQAASDVVATLADEGIPPDKTLLLGFSQGACLALEFAARHPDRYGGVVALSGGLIGNGERDADPPEDKTFDYDGSLDDTPVFLGCSDRDPHIPLRRVEQTAETLERHGAAVTKRIYEGMGHTITADEIDHARTFLDRLTNTPS
jgi:predicted esterase